MDRFTEKFKDGRNILRKGISDVFHIGFGRFFEGEAVDRLAAYEDLEEQGKLLKLPCAVGETVYTNASMQGWYFRKENRPYAAKVVFVGINGADNYINVDFGNGHMMQFKFSDFGQSVFLTREEAELKELEGKGIWID